TIEAFYDARMVGVGRVLVQLTVGLGAMGLSLTMVGLYGLVAYAVSRRTREIGIRMAIGATHGRILRMVLHDGMQPAWLGLAAGIGASAAAARLLGGILPFNHRIDARTFSVVVPLVVVVTLAAAFLPARRAARVDPTTALRTE